MSSKMLILVSCLATMVSLITADDISPGVIRSADEKGLQDACAETLKNCQTGLRKVYGGGGIAALSLSVQISALIAPLLSGLVAILITFLDEVPSLVCELLEIVLAALTKIITLVVKLLTGLIGKSEYNSKVYDWRTETTNAVNSYSETELYGIIPILLRLVLSIFGICATMNILAIIPILG